MDRPSGCGRRPQPAVEPPELDELPDDEELVDPDELDGVDEDSLAPEAAGAVDEEELLVAGPSAALAALRLSVR